MTQHVHMQYLKSIPNNLTFEELGVQIIKTPNNVTAFVYNFTYILIYAVYSLCCAYIDI